MLQYCQISGKKWFSYFFFLNHRDTYTNPGHLASIWETNLSYFLSGWKPAKTFIPPETFKSDYRWRYMYYNSAWLTQLQIHRNKDIDYYCISFSMYSKLFMKEETPWLSSNFSQNYKGSEKCWEISESHSDLLLSFAQWRYSNQWSNREVLLLLVENYTQYPA